MSKYEWDLGEIKIAVRIGKGLYLDVQFLLPITTSMI